MGGDGSVKRETAHDGWIRRGVQTNDKGLYCQTNNPDNNLVNLANLANNNKDQCRIGHRVNSRDTALGWTPGTTNGADTRKWSGSRWEMLVETLWLGLCTAFVPWAVVAQCGHRWDQAMDRFMSDWTLASTACMASCGCVWYFGRMSDVAIRDMCTGLEANSPLGRRRALAGSARNKRPCEKHWSRRCWTCGPCLRNAAAVVDVFAAAVVAVTAVRMTLGGPSDVAGATGTGAVVLAVGANGCRAVTWPAALLWGAGMVWLGLPFVHRGPWRWPKSISHQPRLARIGAESACVAVCLALAYWLGRTAMVCLCGLHMALTLGPLAMEGADRVWSNLPRFAACLRSQRDRPNPTMASRFTCAMLALKKWPRAFTLGPLPDRLRHAWQVVGHLLRCMTHLLLSAQALTPVALSLSSMAAGVFCVLVEHALLWRFYVRPVDMLLPCCNQEHRRIGLYDGTFSMMSSEPNRQPPLLQQLSQRHSLSGRHPIAVSKSNDDNSPCARSSSASVMRDRQTESDGHDRRSMGASIFTTVPDVPVVTCSQLAAGHRSSSSMRSVNASSNRTLPYALALSLHWVLHHAAQVMMAAYATACTNNPPSAF